MLCFVIHVLLNFAEIVGSTRTIKLLMTELLSISDFANIRNHAIKIQSDCHVKHKIDYEKHAEENKQIFEGIQQMITFY